MTTPADKPPESKTPESDEPQTKPPIKITPEPATPEPETKPPIKVESDADTGPRHTVQMDEQRLRRRMIPMLLKKVAASPLDEVVDASRSTATESKPITEKIEPKRASGFLILPSRTLWVVNFDGLGAGAPQGIAFPSEIVLGISSSADNPADFDLKPFGATDKGVSRRHAMLRPAHDKLYLIDLKSTNGCSVNGKPIKPEEPTEVKHNDLIGLGALTFTLRVLASPEDVAEAAEEESGKGGMVM